MLKYNILDVSFSVKYYQMCKETGKCDYGEKINRNVLLMEQMLILAPKDFNIVYNVNSKN